MSDAVLGKINNNAAINQQMNSDSAVQKQKIQQINKSIASSSAKHQHEVKSVSPKDLQNTIDKINENVSILNKDVKFVYNDTIKSLVVKVINAKTGKVIREIPPKEVINLQKKLSEVVGIIFDSKEVK